VATITQIREGLATNLATISGFQVSAYVLANPTPPAIQIMPGDITYDLALRRGLDEITMTVQAFVAFTADIGSQAKLDELLEPTGADSLKTAVEADRTLGGLVGDVHVLDASGYRVAQGTNGPVLMCEWTVQVLASN
jgi:hypothetical protein